MVEDILKTKPNDPVRIQYYLNYCKLILIQVLYMIQYLEKKYNINLNDFDSIINLEDLRKELQE